MKERIRARALELGFDDCRVTTAHPPATADAFRQWLAKDFQGAMGYLDRTATRRVDPQQVLPGAQSIIVLGINYYTADSLLVRDTAGPSRRAGDSSPTTTRPGVAGGADPPTPRQVAADSAAGLIARYARWQDYHLALREPLQNLAQYLLVLGGPEVRSKGYTDTGPVLERDLAQRAGLGFIGKHTNVISSQFGNWMLLAEILTTLPLEPDPPARNRCGTCRRCLDVCPTQAFTAAFELDARRCLSYWTIEWKGGIPVELRPALGRRIFGCDDCLAACPWNRFARESRWLQSQARPDLEEPSLIELAGLDDAGFKRKFRGTALERIKRRGLVRNVCVALGNSRDTRALPVLRQLTSDPDSLIAEHADWAIRQIELAVF